MATVAQIKEEINRLKKETGTTILVHAYQSQDILEIADYVGDSYGLAVQAAQDPAKNIIMCGVRFMAETCKILSPEKTVLLPKSEAGCPMAEQLSPADLQLLKEKYPDHAVVAYVNTTADLKTLADACVTSANAVKICERIDRDKILFIPDINLGTYVSEKVKDKEFSFIHGGCPKHFAVTKEKALKVKEAHPEALLLVHPECKKEVSDLADYVGSTTGIMNYVKNSDHDSFIIGTENSITEHLQFEYPEKNFYPLSVDLVCTNMKATTLMDVYKTLKGQAGEKIVLAPEVIEKAARSLENMLELAKD